MRRVRRDNGMSNTLMDGERENAATAMNAWSVVIVSARESVDTLMGAILAARAASDASTPIDVIINGNRPLADAVSARAEHLLENLRIWFITTRDKAHALNEYVERIWPGSQVVFFLDGNVRAMPDAFRVLAVRLREDNNALSASGVPPYDWSARFRRGVDISEGGLAGNLCVLRGDTLALLRSRRIRLPLGLYRTDGVLGAIIAFNLDPSTNKWDARRIPLHSSATWRIDSVGLWKRFIDACKRRLRQAQGTLETMAVRQHLSVERKPPEELPRTAADLVTQWMARHPSQARAVCWKNPLCFLAARQLVAPKDWASTHVPPILLHASNGKFMRST
jgi:hypothetical protein